MARSIREPVDHPMEMTGHVNPKDILAFTAIVTAMTTVVEDNPLAGSWPFKSVGSAALMMNNAARQKTGTVNQFVEGYTYG